MLVVENMSKTVPDEKVAKLIAIYVDELNQRDKLQHALGIRIALLYTGLATEKELIDATKPKEF